MRPLMAVAVGALLVALWFGWRFSRAEAEILALLAAVDTGRDAIEVASAAPETGPTLRITGPIDVSLSTRSETNLTHHEPRAPFYRHPGEGRNPVTNTISPGLDPGLRRDDGLGREAFAVQARDGAEQPPVASDRNSAVSGTSDDAANGFALATAAYAELNEGDRRAAADRFDAALAATPDDPRAPAWRAARDRLGRRWSAAAYAILRERTDGEPSAELPVLSGPQYGAEVRYRTDPLTRRPLDLIARATFAPGISGAADIAEAVAGIGWQPLGRTGPEIALERRIELTSAGRDAMQLRLSGGVSESIHGPTYVDAYADSGVVGAESLDLFAGGQAFVGYRLTPALSFGGGAWGGWQDDGVETSRVEVGPFVRFAAPVLGGGVDVRAAYRARIAGTLPAENGATLTLSARY